MSKSLITLVVFVLLTSASSWGAPYDGSAFVLQRSVPNQRIVKVTIKPSSTKESEVVYEEIGSQPEPGFFSKSKKINVQALSLSLAPLFNQEGLKSWPSDKDCIGKETWRLQMGKGRSEFICDSRQKLKVLRKTMVSLKVLLQN